MFYLGCTNRGNITPSLIAAQLHSLASAFLLLYNVRNPCRQNIRGLFCLDHDHCDETIGQSLIKIIIFTLRLCSLKTVIAPGSTLRSISFSEWADTEQCYTGKLLVFTCQLIPEERKNTQRDGIEPGSSCSASDHSTTGQWLLSHLLYFTACGSGFGPAGGGGIPPGLSSGVFFVDEAPCGGCRSIPSQAREYVESLHQNQKDSLLYGEDCCHHILY